MKTQPQLQIFTLPMRNWNYFFVSPLIHTQRPNFYSTYEALKLIRVFSSLRSLFHFYSTYEELKLSSEVEGANHKMYFYSTYEELKRLTSLKLSRGWYKFLLYLWGIETFNTLLLRQDRSLDFYSTYEELKRKRKFSQFKECKSFLLYLWGIETRTDLS